MKPEVSYILAILNGISTIRECLQSIVNQEHNYGYEVLVLDGGSTDGTLEVVRDFSKTYSQIKLIHNPNKLSEGKGNGKDMGVSLAKGKYLVFLDHDNILLHRDWLKIMLAPLEQNKKIMASQSLLKYRRGDSQFLKYVNALGVEDPFAVDYSLVSQVVLNPDRFDKTNGYYLHQLDPTQVLFGGANGCIFRKEVFTTIGNYTRDVDVFKDMADHRMFVAVPDNAYLHHQTSNSLYSFMKKKGVYYYRFIKNDYSWKKYSWAGNNLRSKIQFWIRIASNLSILVPLATALKQWGKNREVFWLLHPLYTFYITLEYGLITLFFLRNYLKYVRKN